MSRMRLVALWIACSLPASCVQSSAAGRVQPGPVAGTPDPRSSPPLGGAAAGVDMGWNPYAVNPVPMVHRHSRDAGEPGPFRYSMLYTPGTSLGARRYSIDVRVTVRTGSEFILMGNLDTARVQRFDAGTTFLIPAGTWHVEWFETRTLVDMEGVGPRRIEWASPAVPRVP